MTRIALSRICAGVFVIMLLSTWASPSSALVLEAVQDTWVREFAPDTDYNNDLISVWDGADLVDQKPRNGALLFDLSSSVGVTINSAHLLLFDRGDGRSTTTPIVQQAYILSTTPPAPDYFSNPYTWNEYVTFDQPNEVLLDSLGHYNIAAGDMIKGYEVSSPASTADITLLQQTRDNASNSNIVAFILKAASGERDWGDIETDGTPPRLAVNWGDFNDDAIVTIADYNVMIDPLNWLQVVPAGTRGDMNNDGFVALDDFSLFKPIYHAANPGAGSLAFGVPEPASITLLFAGAIFVALIGGMRRRFHSAFPAKYLASAAVLLLAAASTANAIVLDSVGDVWIRESAATTTYDGDYVSVWNSFGNDPGTRRYGVVEFDLSSLNGVQLDYATLNLWNFDDQSSDVNKAIKQSAVYINTTGGTQASSLTWSIYQNNYAGSAIALEGLGTYNLPMQSPPIAYSSSVPATVADLALLSTIASGAGGGNQRLTLVLIANESDGVEYAHSWGDGELNGSLNPQLLINEFPPEVVQLTLQVNATSGAMKIVNPGIDPVENTMFDIDGYIIHSPAGALNPGGFTGLLGAGETDWQIIAPTASDLSELNLDSSTMFDEGDSLPLGIGYTPGATEDPDLAFYYNVNGGAPLLGAVKYVTGLDGDFNFDNKVDAADYVIWRKTDGSPAGYNLWRANFGMMAGAGSGVASGAVPEPGAIGILSVLLAAVATSMWRRRGGNRKA